MDTKPRFTLARLVLAISREAVAWWYDPHRRRYLLRARSGRIYAARVDLPAIQLCEL